MFEKDAEERITEQYGTSGEYITRQRIWQDGAEFGYNKAKVEVEEKYKETICNLEMNLASVTERLEELEKANEWHYVKDGVYPTDDKKVLCILGDFENDNLEVGYYSQVEGDSKRWRFEDYDLPDDSENGWGVSAWKEIVPPSEPMRSLDKEEQKNYTKAINKVYKPTGVKLFDKEKE